MTKKQVTMVTFAMVLANVMAGLDSTIINTAIPAIIADLHGIQFMGWIIAIMLLGMSVSTPIWTKVGEKIGNKATFELSLLFFVLGSLFQGLADNMYFFLSFGTCFNGDRCWRNGIAALYYGWVYF